MQKKNFFLLHKNLLDFNTEKEEKTVKTFAPHVWLAPQLYTHCCFTRLCCWEPLTSAVLTKNREKKILFHCPMKYFINIQFFKLETTFRRASIKWKVAHLSTRFVLPGNVRASFSGWVREVIKPEKKSYAAISEGDVIWVQDLYAHTHRTWSDRAAIQFFIFFILFTAH